MADRYGYWIILFLVVPTLLSFIVLKDLKFGFSLEDLYPVNDADRIFLEEFKDEFHAEIDDEYIFIALSNKNGIFRQGFLKKVDELCRFLDSHEDILRVYSITQTGRLYLEDGNLKEDPLIHIDKPALYEQDSIHLFSSREYYNLMMSEDGRSLAVSAFNMPNLKDQVKKDLLLSIERKLEELDFDETSFTAKIRIERTYIDEIRSNFTRSLVLAFILISLVLLFFFRSLTGVTLSLLAVAISICWTLSLIAVTGNKIDVVSSLIPPVLAVICVSNIVHLTAKYFENRQDGMRSDRSVFSAIKAIAPAAFLAAVTSAIGFYSLTLSNIESVIDLGIFTASGILMSFVVSTAIVYLWFTYHPPSENQMIRFRLNGFFKTLKASFQFVSHRKVPVILLYTFLLIVFSALLSRVEVNSSLLQEIPRNNPILEDYRFVENKFSGNRAFEMAVFLKDSINSSFLDLEILRQLEALEVFLREECNTGFILSPVSFIKAANRAYNGGNPTQFKLPDSDRMIRYYHNKILFTSWQLDMLRFITPDAKLARISGKLPDLSMQEFEVIRTKLNNYFNENTDRLNIKWKLTGSAIMIDKISTYLIRNMITGLALAIFIISVIIWIWFRSLRMMLIVLIPNLFPLLMMAALMSALDIYLKADTSVIFAIAFGIVLDDTIHLLNRFKIELSKGTEILEALQAAYLQGGKAMVITTVILFSGFAVLLTSTFTGIFNIGLLISLSLLFALIMDLTLLPVLILLFYKKS